MKRWKPLALAGVGRGGRGSPCRELGRPRGSGKDNKAVTLVWWHNANQGAGQGPVGTGGARSSTPSTRA